MKMPEVIGKKQDYYQRMSIDELAEFMSAEQEWNLARTCQVADLTNIREGGEFSSKPVLVQGTDGVMYGGVAAAYHGWLDLDNPALVLHFALGKNQTDTKPLDERMSQLGFQRYKDSPIFESERADENQDLRVEGQDAAFLVCAYERLKKLSPEHELLRYVNITGERSFEYVTAHAADFKNMFGTDHEGHKRDKTQAMFAYADLMGKYADRFVALRKNHEERQKANENEK